MNGMKTTNLQFYPPLCSPGKEHPIGLEMPRKECIMWRADRILCFLLQSSLRPKITLVSTIMEVQSHIRVERGLAWEPEKETQTGSPRANPVSLGTSHK